MAATGLSGACQEHSEQQVLVWPCTMLIACQDTVIVEVSASQKAGANDQPCITLTLLVKLHLAAAGGTCVDSISAHEAAGTAITVEGLAKIMESSSGRASVRQRQQALHVSVMACTCWHFNSMLLRSSKRAAGSGLCASHNPFKRWLKMHSY